MSDDNLEELTDAIQEEVGGGTPQQNDRQEINSQKLTVLINNVRSNLVDDADDLGDMVNELKGFLNETLGDLPFKFAITLVVFLNFLYTFYEAFFSTSILNDEVKGDCYCDPTDRAFYRTVLFLSMVFWISFLIINALYCIFRHINCHKEARLNSDRSKKISLITDTLDALKKNERKLKSYLRYLVTTNVLDDDHCKGIENHYNSLYLKRATDCNTSSSDDNDNIVNVNSVNPDSNQLNEASWRWCRFMAFKVILIVIRYIFRLLIVPLLQLQLLNDYAWNCIMNNIIRNYCADETGSHYISLDHSFVIYSVYILLLIALLISVLIRWFPKGLPQVVLLYKTERLIKRLKITINKDHQFQYKPLVNENESDTDPDC